MEFWIVAGLAAFLLGLSKGGIPTFALLSVPLMSLFMDPAMAAGLLLPLYHAADVYAVYLFRKAYSARNLKILLPGALAGVLAGFFAVAVVPGNALKLLVAAIGLAYIANSVWNRMSRRVPPPRPATVPRGLVLGSLAGLTSYISHAGGPPFQVYILPQRLDKLVYLGTTTVFFATVNLMKLPPYIVAGQVTMESVSQVVWMVPLALAGAWCAARLARAISERVFYILVEAALGTVSVKLAYDVFVAWFA